MKATDPVCGMEIENTIAAAQALHGVRAYHFRSSTCRDHFGRDPEHYADATSLPKAREKFPSLGVSPLVFGLLNRIVTKGTLVIAFPSGETQTVGTGTPEVSIRILDEAVLWRILVQPTLAVGEAYTDGTLVIERGSVRDFLDICTSNLGALDETWVSRLLAPLARLAGLAHQYNPAWRSRRNVEHHYDLSAQLYRLFLDDDLQYSCAYFGSGSETLEEAQARKKRHIAAKLLLEPGQSVLDIGSGWGGLAIDLARQGRCDVTGITLSREQVKAANQRAALSDVAQDVRFQLRDYRHQTGSYDRIVSVGMFEHVGVAHYRTFFDAVGRLLKPDGVALVHAIGHMGSPGGCDPWIRKYIFPGGYCPALSEVLAAAERTDLWVTDVEILRLQYAETLRHWYERFQKSRDQVRKLYDERFCRMWEFYLAACEMMFRNSFLMVFQIQLAHRKDAVPWTRDYITDFDRAAISSGKTIADPA